MAVAYFQRATQYYAAGRQASLAQLFPVNATLLHHAVELFLKGGLLRALSLNDLEAIRHNLKKLWRVFGEHFPDSTLSAHDATVAALHKFERIRYPDAEVLKGMVGQFAVLRSEVVPVQRTRGVALPKYDLVLEDVDHLVQVVFSKVNARPAAYYLLLGTAARRNVNERNAYPWPTDA